MATKTQADDGPQDQTSADPNPTGSSVHEAFERAVQDFTAALELMRAGEFAPAKEKFEEIARVHIDEAVLVERARTYTRHCERRLAPPEPEPQTADEMFARAVVHSNNGEVDAALKLLDRALQLEPESPRLFYSKAAAAAIKGDAEAAVGDLRRAIAAEPQIRFQAGNDPDFESIREEPAFIDIIEPTPTGA